MGGNLGIGFDVGATYHLKENITIMGSVLDIGFISYSNDISTYKVSGSYEVNGLGLLDPPANETFNYWDALSDNFNTQVQRETLRRTYISFKSPKINGALQYGFGKQVRKKYRATACPAINEKSAANYQNEVGVQFYSIFRPKQPQVATTLYYSRNIANAFKAKVTYTADSYSFSNIGLGFSAQINKFNLYASADNLLSYSNIYNSKKLSILFGINLIFDN